MKTYSDVIIKSIFTESEINQLKSIFDYEQKNYLDRLDIDTFAYDYTAETIEETIKPLLEHKNIDCQEHELKDLIEHITYYFI